jgi:plastocyanin
VRPFVIVGTTALLLAVLYVAFARQSSGPAPGPKTFQIALQDGRLVSSPAVFDAVEGDRVTLSIISDKPATVHVHEYEQQVVVTVNAGEPAVSSFTANRAGRFAVHVMGIDPSHPEVAAIQVHPR